MNPTPLIIGVDVGIGENTGVSEYLPKEKRFREIFSMDIFDAYEMIMAYYDNPDYAVIVVVENSDMDSNVFGAAEALIEYAKNAWAKITYKKDPKKDVKFLSKIRASIAQGSNVGKNKGIAKSFVVKLLAKGVKVAQIKPSSRDKYPKIVTYRTKVNGKTVNMPYMERGKPKILPVRQMKMPTKLPAKEFKQLTGYMGKTNEHGRDSATPLVGKDFFYWSNMARNQMQFIEKEGYSKFIKAF